VRSLPDDLLECHRIGQRHAGVPGEQLKELELDVAQRLATVQRVQRAVRLAADVREAERDRVQARQRRPDQVVELAGLPGGHHDGLAGPHQLADEAAVKRGDTAPQPGRKAGGRYQAEPVVLDEHEAAAVRACQLAEAASDPVKHRFQVPLRVHVRDHVAETSHDPRPLSHVVPGDVVLAGLVTDVHPSGHVAVGPGEGAGVNANVNERPVLADPPGGEGDLAAAAYPLEHRVVLRGELLRDIRRLGPEYLVARPAEHPLGRGVPQHDRTIGVKGNDRVRRALDDRARRRVNPGRR
jgi:hypothetical protein